MRSQDSVRQQLILALDVPTATEALAIARELNGCVGMFKVGMELFYSVDGGHSLVHALREAAPDVEIFLDLKVADIPNTMRGAIRSIKPLAPRFLTVHAANGAEHLVACVEEAGDIGILAVTVLTSIGPKQALEIGGIPSFPGDWEQAQRWISQQVRSRAAMAAIAKCAGIVCSGTDLADLGRSSKDLLRIVPGIRMPGAAADDQKRVMTPWDAIKSGANYIVIGRSILNPTGMSRQEAAERIVANMAGE